MSPRPALIGLLIALCLAPQTTGCGPKGGSTGPPPAAASYGYGLMSPAEQEGFRREQIGALPADMRAFFEMEITGPASPGDRKAEERALLTQIQDMTRALLALERDCMQNDSSPLVLGLALEHMGEALSRSYVPSYLSADQAELYRWNLDDKRQASDEKAANVYWLVVDRALAASPETPASDAELRFARTRLQDIAERTLSCPILKREPEAMALCEQRIGPELARQAQLRAAKEKQGHDTLAELDRKLQQLEAGLAGLEGCSTPAAQALRETGAIVSEQARKVLAARETDMARDILDFVNDALGRLPAAQASCAAPR